MNERIARFARCDWASPWRLGVRYSASPPGVRCDRGCNGASMAAGGKSPASHQDRPSVYTMGFSPDRGTGRPPSATPMTSTISSGRGASPNITVIVSK